MKIEWLITSVTVVGSLTRQKVLLLDILEILVWLAKLCRFCGLGGNFVTWKPPV